MFKAICWVLLLACYGNTSGLIGILGTGANTAYYDGTILHQKAPSLGYLLGDEGSGAHLGRLLLSAGLRDELPTDLLRKLNLNKEFILEKIYKGSSTNSFGFVWSFFVSKQNGS